MDHCFAVVYRLMNIHVLQNEGKSLASYELSSIQEGPCSIETFMYLDAV